MERRLHRDRNCIGDGDEYYTEIGTVFKMETSITQGRRLHAYYIKIIMVVSGSR